MFRFIKQNRIIPILLIVILAFFLRVYQVNKLPPGLYDDEVSLGYNSYSVLTYGKDEYGETLPLWFKAFGEYKLPGYIYADIIPIAIFGKNALSVRLPSVIFGSLTPLFLYLFLRNLISIESKSLKNKFKHAPLISALILAIIPWHIQFSRGAYEAIVAVCLYVAGCWQLTVFYKKKDIFPLIAGLLLFILASYTYNSFRMITPLAILVIFYFLFKTKYISLQKIIFISFCTILLHIPLLLFTFSNHGYARFLQTSIFTEHSLSGTITSQPTAFSFITYPFLFIKNYLSYFSLQELFLKGNDNVRFYSSSEFAFLFRWQLPFLIFGFLGLLRSKSKILKKTVLGIFLIVPAAMAITVSPNALRSLLLTIPLSTVIAIGIQSAIYYRKLWARIALGGIILLAVYETSLYFHMYFSHYKNSYEIFWGGAKEKIVQEATKYSDIYDTIVINEDFLQNEKIYFLFYNDKLKPIFVDSSWQKPSQWKDKDILYIRYPAPIPPDAKMKELEVITLDTPLKQPVAQFIQL